MKLLSQMDPGDPPVTEEDIKKMEKQEKEEKEEGLLFIVLNIFVHQP